MSGCTLKLKHRENRKVIFIVSSYKHVEMITKEVFIFGRIPAPGTVGLRKLTFAGTVIPQSALTDSF